LRVDRGAARRQPGRRGGRRARHGRRRCPDHRGVGAMSAGGARLAARARAGLWAATALVAASTTGGCSEQLLNPMADRQPRARAYHPSESYDDQLAMRAPPDGTVPRERRATLLVDQAIGTGVSAFTGQIAPNGERLVRYASRIPVPVTRQLLDLGRKRYD